MADLLRERAEVEARVVSTYELLHKLGEVDRERILERLNSRTTGDIRRDLALRESAKRRLASYERRSGRDRRSGQDRRSDGSRKPPLSDRRSGTDRRSGRDRRGITTASG
jgi:hypothetical protein